MEAVIFLESWKVNRKVFKQKKYSLKMQRKKRRVICAPLV